ncbi:cytochrome c oxidase subunit 3 [Alterisphingorhabdus coralli]|uniref:Cytochrome c oxidase subunit 3 n=1 Tax=Alterisphingorhabdus coralli TaxID=3071408 RepID=A0AA97I0T0_9SPHN|nr:cytochrome c oxidase subunit 3 [Parasphingorhabdus sp. SCSIO 66989]WOE76009.1 cytochrome c oxidase subunit 3 [Parasphingorhabdus sp. SCSIO 66989]
MAGTKNHDYHILPPSAWPLIGSMAALVMAAGAIMWMHGANVSDENANGGGWVFFAGVAGVLFTMFGWWRDVVREAHAGDHTPVVQLHLRYGMILFIASEVMFFVGWFWAWFDFSLFPQPLEFIEGITENKIGAEGAEALVQWPPKGVEVLNAFELPLLNTLILLLSGTTVTWAHHSLLNGDRDGLIKGLWVTVILGALFSFVQAYEYSVAPFPFAGLNYSSAFYMATGFHGFHVLVGTIFLIVCLVRAYLGHFTPKQHFGFEAAAWYWHFVDVVWLFLFAVVYVWGGWGAPIH